MRRKGSLFRELPILVVVALVVSLLIKTFLVQFFYIPSGSMENTLQVKDRVAVNKVPFLWRNIARGDVVVFRDPAGWLPEITDYSTNKYIAKVKTGLVAVVYCLIQLSSIWSSVLLALGEIELFAVTKLAC